MELLERIEDQIAATGLPLVGVTLAAVPCPDTPVILSLHWHGFITEKITSVNGAQPVAYTPVPSSALQVNDRWDDLTDVDQAALVAAWRMGAWDVQRAEQPACVRPGARHTEPLACMQAFGAYALSMKGNPLAVSDIPDADELIYLAACRGYLMWLFRPVAGGIWNEVSTDTTLAPDGHRAGPCPHRPIEPVTPGCSRTRQTVYRFGVALSAPNPRPPAD